MALSVLTKGHKATYIASLLQVGEKRINIGGGVTGSTKYLN